MLRPISVSIAFTHCSTINRVPHSRHCLMAITTSRHNDYGQYAKITRFLLGVTVRVHALIRYK